MIEDCWEQLLSLKTKLVMSSDRTTTLKRLPDDEVVIEVYADDVEQAMFIVTANRMADLLGIVCFRVDIEGGNPQMVFSFGTTVEDAKVRTQRYCKARERDIKDGVES